LGGSRKIDEAKICYNCVAALQIHTRSFLCLLCVAFTHSPLQARIRMDGLCAAPSFFFGECLNMTRNLQLLNKFEGYFWWCKGSSINLCLSFLESLQLHKCNSPCNRSSEVLLSFPPLSLYRQHCAYYGIAQNINQVSWVTGLVGYQRAPVKRSIIALDGCLFSGALNTSPNPHFNLFDLPRLCLPVLLSVPL
jgi:hypothetical protein